MTIDELKVIINAETKGYDKAIKKVTQSTKSLQKTLSRAFGVTALVAFSKSCLEAASDLEEVQNVVDVSFGSMADSAEEFAKSAMASFGITELQAKRVSSTFMAMSNSIGLTKGTARDMSLSLTALAADMSSFYNVSLESAQNALQGIFTGNTRALRQYGVVIEDATLQEYALSQGISKSVSTMTAAEKITLRYNYTMNALSNVIGDYTRTSGSWANQIRLLTNQFNQLKVALGTILKGILGPILVRLNLILGRIVQIANVAAKAFGTKSEMSKASQGITEYNAGLGEAYTTAVKLRKTIAGFDELNVLQSQDSADEGAVGGGAIADIEVPNLDDYLSKVEEVTKESSEGLTTIQKILLAIAGISGFLWLDKFIQGIPIVSALSKIAKEGIIVWGQMGKTVMKSTGPISNWLLTVRSLGGAIKGQLFGTAQRLGTELTTVSEVANKISFGKVVTTIGLVVGAIVLLVTRFKELYTTNDEFKNRVLGAWDGIKNGLSVLVQAFAPLWECFKNLMDTVKRLWTETIKPSFDAIADLVISVVLNIIEITGQLLSGPLAEVIRIVVYIASIAIDAINSIFNVLSPYFAAFTGVMIPLIIKVIEGVLSTVTKVVGGIIQFVGSLLSVISGAISKVHDWIHNIAEKVSSVFWSIVNGIRGAVNGMIGLIEGAINGIVSSFNNSGLIRGINKILGTSIQLGYVYIPRLAKGGVATTPTIAEIGEYSGARSNPEIVAPQSILKETIDASNGELASVFAQIGMQIIQAIDRKDLDVQISDTTIAKSAARGNRNWQLATGQSLF